MKPKTTIYTLFVLSVLLCSSPLSAQSEHTPTATLASWKQSKTTTATGYRSASNARYLLFQGQVLGENQLPVGAFHMDVYERKSDGQRTLIRTGPYPTSQYQLHLESGVSYELVVQANGYDTKQVFLDASEENLPSTTIMLRPRPAAINSLPNLQFAIVAQERALSLPDWQAVAAYGSTATLAETVTPLPFHSTSLSRRGMVATGTPLLRGLNADDGPLLQLPANAEVEILEQTTPDWWMVSYHGEMGWVRASMIR